MLVAALSIIAGILFMAGPALLVIVAQIHVPYAGVLGGLGVVLIANGVRIIWQARKRDA